MAINNPEKREYKMKKTQKDRRPRLVSLSVEIKAQWKNTTSSFFVGNNGARR